MDPSQLLATWNKMSAVPGGKRAFSKVVGWMAPYTGTLGARVQELQPGFCRVEVRDRRAVRNHLNSIHAIALMNLGEVVTGLAMYSGLPAGGRGIIVNLAMDYKRKARGTLSAEASCVLPADPGRHDVRIVADLTDGSGEVVATATATWNVEIPQPS